MNLERHEKDYKKHAWNNYSIMELGNWVHNFVKRSEHRSNKDKASKDFHDAKNYLGMIEEMVKIQADKLNIDWESI